MTTYYTEKKRDYGVDTEKKRHYGVDKKKKKKEGYISHCNEVINGGQKKDPEIQTKRSGSKFVRI